MNFKSLGLVVGVILALLSAACALIVSALAAFVVQLLWLCVAMPPMIVSAISVGLAMGVMRRENFSLTNRQEVLAQWFVCWPLLSAIYLIQKSGNWLFPRLANIPGV